MKTMHLMETMAQRSPTLAPLDAKKADLAFFLVHCATPLLVDQVRLPAPVCLKAGGDGLNVLDADCDDHCAGAAAENDRA